MLIRIVKQPIQIVRNGALVYPPVGSRVELTQQEVDDFKRVNPSALDYIITAEPAAAEPVRAAVKTKPAAK